MDLITSSEAAIVMNHRLFRCSKVIVEIQQFRNTETRGIQNCMMVKAKPS